MSLLSEIFAAMAGKAEQKLSDLAYRQEGNLHRRQTLDQIEERFNELASDGYIDEREMKELLGRLGAAGLDGASLERLYAELKGTDSSVRAGDGSKFAEAFEDLMEKAERKVIDSQSDTNFEIQVAMSDATNFAYASSQSSKEDHEIKMHIIGNLKA
jgi:hypothetical protein